MDVHKGKQQLAPFCFHFYSELTPQLKHKPKLFKWTKMEIILMFKVTRDYKQENK